MSERERRIRESTVRLERHLADLRDGNARARARLAAEPPHRLYAAAARLAADARARGSAAELRQAGRWEALADAIIRR